MVRDGKSELQNLIQGKGLGTPVYRIVSSSGPSHDPTFKAEVTLGNQAIGHGTGKSKKEAEQNSALEALKNFKS
jgi:ribonuclease III